jgi:hypothetical protein
MDRQNEYEGIEPARQVGAQPGKFDKEPVEQISTLDSQ